jgi:hypothetical protein
MSTTRKFKKPRINTYPNVEDIKLFFNTSSKSDNDSSNKKREDILEYILTADIENKGYFDHPEFGSSWTDVKNKFYSALKKIYSQDFDNVSVTKTAGRKYNYDFNIDFYSNNQKVFESHVEFKYNATNLKSLPQILQLGINFNMINYSYAEYFFNNYLDKYILCDSELSNTQKPTLQEYLKVITTTEARTSKIPLIKLMKERYDIQKEEKFSVVNESINTFLHTYLNQFNIQNLSEKLQNTQKNKYFLMWNNDFNIETLDDSETNISNVLEIINDNTIVVKANTYKYKILLRWKNGKGILNPAWQISITY